MGLQGPGAGLGVVGGRWFGAWMTACSNGTEKHDEGGGVEGFPCVSIPGCMSA